MPWIATETSGAAAPVRHCARTRTRCPRSRYVRPTTLTGKLSRARPRLARGDGSGLEPSSRRRRRTEHEAPVGPGRGAGVGRVRKGDRLDGRWLLGHVLDEPVVARRPGGDDRRLRAGGDDLHEPARGEHLRRRQRDHDRTASHDLSRSRRPEPARAQARRCRDASRAHRRARRRDPHRADRLRAATRGRRARHRRDGQRERHLVHAKRERARHGRSELRASLKSRSTREPSSRRSSTR